MKIAMLGHKRIPSREGGIEIVVEELSTRMSGIGHDVTCFNRKGHHISGKEFDNASKSPIYKGVKLKTVASIEKKGAAAVISSFFATIMATFGGFDVIHFHAEGPCAMLWIPHLLKKHCVATIHGLDWQREKWGNSIASKFIRLGEKMAARYADEIIVLSRNVQEYFLKTYNRKTIFIPNGVSKPTQKPADLIQREYGLTKDSYILFLGRIVPEKGIRHLINAFKGLQTDKKLVIAGGASDTEIFYKSLKELAQDDSRILFTGFVAGQKLEELYSNAYIYTLPSDLEGMPLSLLEAMSYGNCCVVSDIAECADVVEQNAVTFKKGDETDLQLKLQELLDTPQEVENLKKQAADFICNKYNWDDIVQQTVELYKGKN